MQFKELITEYQDVFSKDDFDLGCLSSGVEHKIQTHDEIPVAEKFRRTPLHFQKQEKEYIEKLSKQGVIEPSVSEWSAPPVLVRKKAGELRYCIDYRSLNAKTYKDSYSYLLLRTVWIHCMARNCSVSLTSVQNITKSRWKRNPGKRHHLIPDLAVFNGRGYPWVFVPLGPRSKGPCHWF